MIDRIKREVKNFFNFFAVLLAEIKVSIKVSLKGFVNNRNLVDVKKKRKDYFYFSCLKRSGSGICWIFSKIYLIVAYIKPYQRNISGCQAALIWP
jgi:hypothetical protein